jgi:phage terminase small subunit
MNRANVQLLNIRQKRFVAEYCQCFSSTTAARRAGYKSKNADVTGPVLLATPNVRAAIDARFARAAKKTDMSETEIITELAKVARSDMSRFAKWGKAGVALGESSELAPDESGAISEISESKTKDGRNLRLKLHDKTKALELLARIKGMFKDHLELNTENPIQIVISPTVAQPAGESQGRE